MNSDDHSFKEGYIFGALCSRGTLIYNERESIFLLSFETSDETIMEAFVTSWANVFNEEYKIYTKIASGKKRLVFRIYDKKLSRRLFYSYGLRTGSSRWKVPEKIMASQDGKRGFISGFFDSGCYIRIRLRHRSSGIEKVRNIRISTQNVSGLEFLKTALMELGIKPVVYKAGKSFCMDIEGRMKIESFNRKVGFVSATNVNKIINALSFFHELVK
jgi:hypothetical protein